MRNGWMTVAALAAAVLLTATGCSSSFFEPTADPVGTWTLAPDGGSTIVVRADHTFTAEGIPQSVACAHQRPENYSGPCASDPVDFTGTWSLRENNPIEIIFDGDDLVGMSGVRSAKTLGFWVGDREPLEPTYKYVHD